MPIQTAEFLVDFNKPSGLSVKLRLSDRCQLKGCAEPLLILAQDVFLSYSLNADG